MALAGAVLGAVGYAYWKYAIPTHHVEIRSALVMLGDLDSDNRWTAGDLTILDRFLQDPFAAPDDLAGRLDLNQNGVTDAEDLDILRALMEAGGDPYGAEASAKAAGRPFPRPRECYSYEAAQEYHPRPMWALPHTFSPALVWFTVSPGTGPHVHAAQLDTALYNEAVRFDEAWRKRQSGLLPIEKSYADMKLARAKALFDAGEKFGLLLAFEELVEDAETLTQRGQPETPLKMLAFRDHLREVLASSLYAEFAAGRANWREVLKPVSGYLKADFGLDYNFETLGPPRSLTHLQNYLDRTEWQYYKSTTREDDFRKLVVYAQHEPRYLRAVSRTSPRLTDLSVDNHNLPMVLLFREALRISGNDKKRAVGLLDEAIRIPYAWIKSIPRAALPSALALDNFLLPGNKEDGADKSRHWNVFGGICLYKTPVESLDLALRREMQDLRDANYSKEDMREFFRDMIANLNGMYHVMTVNPTLLASPPK